MRRKILIVLVGASLIAGCGSGSSPEKARFGTASSPTSAAFKHAYLAQRPVLNRIVLDIDRALATIKPTDASAAPRFTALANRIANALRRLVLVPLPAELSLPFGQIVGGLGRVEGDLRALSAALASHNPELTQGDSQALVAELRRLAGPAALIRTRLGIS